MSTKCDECMVCPLGSKIEKRRSPSYFAVDHDYFRKRSDHPCIQEKGWSSHIPQEGLPYNCPTRGTIHSHTIPTTTPLHCPPLSETPSSHLTSKAGLPKHFNSDSTHNIFQNKHTLPSPLTHNTLPSLSQHTSAVFDLVSLHLPFHCLRLNSCLLRHCHL